MSQTFLATTSSAGLQPLGSAAQRSYELVTGTLRDRLGPRHAALFGEPVATAHGETVDWYAHVAGRPEPLAALSDEDAAAVQKDLGKLVGEIAGVAAELSASDAPEDRRLGEALSNAVEIPDEAMIHAVRDADGTLHPVLVHWAWLRDEQRAVRGVLTAMVPRDVPLSVAAQKQRAAAEAARGPWAGWWWLILLGWLLLAVLLGAILYILIAPCGLQQGRLFFCPADPAGLTATETEHRVARDRIARLQHDLAQMDRSCRATIPVEATPVPPSEPKKDTAPQPDPTETDVPSEPLPEEDQSKTDADRADVTRRMTDRGAGQGALNFALEWTTTDDIDLAVTCPSGKTISYKNRADCGGVHDLDANVDRATAVADPVENVTFQDVAPGLYKVTAQLKGNRNDGDKRVTLHVLRRDGRSQSYSGRVGANTPEWTVNLSISG